MCARLKQGKTINPIIQDFRRPRIGVRAHSVWESLPIRYGSPRPFGTGVRAYRCFVMALTAARRALGCRRYSLSEKDSDSADFGSLAGRMQNATRQTPEVEIFI